MAVLEKIKEQIRKLSLDKVHELEKFLSGDVKRRGNTIIQESLEMLDSCPHCTSNEIILWGNYSKSKRFRCNSCKRTFSQTAGTVLHHIKKRDSFMRYASYMFSENFTDLKTISKHIGISLNTAIDWRHKILIALGKEAPCFCGPTEMDAAWFRYSQKGRRGLKQSKKRRAIGRKRDNCFQSKLLLTKERRGVCDIGLVKIGGIVESDISRRLKGKFKESAVLFSDRYKSIRAFSKFEKIKHESFTTDNKDKGYHIQTVNHIARLMNTVFNRKFRGVSTKYLHAYGNWVSAINNYQNHKNKIECILKDCISNRKTWDTFTNIERLYAEFIKNHSQLIYKAPTKRKWKAQLWNISIANLGNFL